MSSVDAVQSVRSGIDMTTYTEASPITIPSDILDDLSSRFIINVPEEERKELVRLCFQIELAHWFYLDFYCTEDSQLRQCSMREFSHIIFNHIPFLREHANNVDTTLDTWREYKMAVPTFGAILLDEKMENVLLVQGYWAKSSWGFPKGKVNKEERPHDCAVREVLEETGFDISKLIDKEEFIDHCVNEQQIRLYIITGVTKDTKFQPKTRKEIKSIEWFPINDLPSHKKDQVSKTNLGLGPNAFFMVIPFIKPLRKWIASKQKKHLQNQNAINHGNQPHVSNSQYVEKSKQKPQYYNLMVQNEFADYMRNKDSRSHKFNYSPPPRMQRLKQHKQLNDSNEFKDNYLRNDEVNSERNGKSNSPSVATSLNGVLQNKREENVKEKSQKSFRFTSATWENFTLDKNALIACFNY
ncbi:m7GpppN-mRNA hydrolase-like [Centruroides sculpturatus]|uniref:m7GpppN-mRNA hydrolase-like n=1 Tax=Centruroides sculpturatus TaxID=218467 RepID=UPI000C6CE3D1|nr:m7GpppN-mRNA hydrolase-like [Centruroides sculpturatus]